MKTFGEYKDRQRIEEKLVPELREILMHLDECSNIAADKNMSKTLDAIEDARAEIISLEGK